MFAPKLYTVRKLELKYILDNNFTIKVSSKDERKFHVNEQDNMLFRQIRLITSDYGDYNKYIIFVDCRAGSKAKEENLSALIRDGFSLNNQRFIFSERSASMTRNSILSFVDEKIIVELDESISMGVRIDKTVLSKYYAYRGLMLSSCHCLENWYPKIIIVPDYYRVIRNQRIKYLYDKEIEFVDKEGNNRIWQQKDITEGTRDIEINVFDGCGIHHPYITEEVQTLLGSSTAPTSIQWRAPFLKGMTHEVNYVEFFSDNGVTEITDIWGKIHGVSPSDPPMIIMFESMYKGLKYFKKTGTYEDWENYWLRFEKYSHCLGVAKWNFGFDEEPIYTRSNYQILQDLNLEYNEFAPLARYTVEWVDKIINGDPLYTYCFLGLFADKCKPLNNYTRAVLKNPEMLKENGVREYFINLVNKKKDEMKCGKLYLNGSFKFLAPDLIMAMQCIGGLEPNGCLTENGFFSQNRSGVFIGERVIERNPHICHSEHAVLVGTDNELRQKYCPNLINVCMVNSKSLIMQRMNGADVDGDLVFVLDSDIIKSGIDRDAAIVMDVDDKVAVEEEADTPENSVKVTLRSMKNLIGEYSNYSSAYHNKVPKTPEQKQKYNNYVEVISVLTGKSIDYSKTGVLYPMPRNIAKFGRPLPYFMRYRSDYYKNLKLSRSCSNMNRLCWELEKWDKRIRWKRTYKDFDYTIMIDYNHLADGNTFRKIEEVFLRFCDEIAQLRKDELSIQKEFGIDIKWDYYYENYRNECEAICHNKKMLANVAVKLCYEKYPNKKKSFMWRIAGDGILQNLQQADILLPLRCDDGDYEYLGKRYAMVDLQNTCNVQDSREFEYLDNIEEEFYID